MLLKFFRFSFAVLFFSSACNLDRLDDPQPVTTFETRFGNTGNIEENGTDVLQLDNGEYIAIGTQEKQPNGDTYGVILKFDAQGNLIQSGKVEGKGLVTFSSVEKAENGNFVVVGSMISDNTNESWDICLAKFNSNLDLVFTKQINRNDDFLEFGSDIIVEADGYLVLGHASFPQYDPPWLFKTDLNGNIKTEYFDTAAEDKPSETMVKTENNKIVVAGGKGGKILVKEYNADFTPTGLKGSYGGTGTLNFAYDIKRVKGKGFVIAGQKAEANNIPNIYFLRIDDNFFLKKDAVFGESGQYGFGESIEIAPDGNYVLAGRRVVSTNFVSVLLKIDEDGNPIWQEQYAPYGLYSVKNAKDGGFIATGTILNNIDGETDIYLVKTNDKGKQE